MLHHTVERRYITSSAVQSAEIANNTFAKDDFSDTVRNMNPPWTFQSGPTEVQYHSFNPWPPYYQDGFTAGWSSGGTHQPAPVGGWSGQRRAEYDGNPFDSIEERAPHGGGQYPQLGFTPEGAWQRQQANTYRPTYFRSPSPRQRDRADSYRPAFSRSPPAWQQPYGDTYRPSYSRSLPPWRQRPTENSRDWRGQAVPTAAPPSQQTDQHFEPRSYQGAQYQYAPSHFQYPQFCQVPMFDYAGLQQQLIMQCRSDGHVLSSSYKPVDSADTPTLDANAQPFIPNDYTIAYQQQPQSTSPPQDGPLPPGIEARLNQQSTTRSQRRKNRQAAKDAQLQLHVMSLNVPLRPRQGLHVEKQHVMKKPVPTERYLEKASKEPFMLKSGRPLLVILDLNGTLILRPKIGSTKFTARPKVNEFLHYLFREHHVLIWSSVMPANVRTIAQNLLSKTQFDQLVGCWGRDRLQIPKGSEGNVYTYKQLSWVWQDEQVIAANPDPVDIWDQENTVLIEDSRDKAVSEPFNAILVEAFKGEKKQMESVVLGQVVRYLETLKYQSDVSAYIKSKPFEYDANAPLFDWMPIINDMH